MARTANLELQHKLEASLHKHLCNNGLDGTTYQKISDDVGISKALMQHYYPRKMDFAIGFLKDIMQAASEVLGIENYAKGALLGYLDSYRLSCLYYGFLLDKEGAQSLLFDILKNREYTDELMHLHYEWGLQFVDSTLPTFEQRPQDVIEVWGGFYELMYFSIKEDFELDIPVRIIHLFEPFLNNVESSQDWAQTFLAQQPSPAQLDELKVMMASERSLAYVA